MDSNKVNDWLHMMKLSPYHEIFYNEWKLNLQGSDDNNIVLNNMMQANIFPNQLAYALQRLSPWLFLLHGQIEELNEGAYWAAMPDSFYIRLDYFESSPTEKELPTYVMTPFNLEKDVLTRVPLIKCLSALDRRR